MGLGLAATAVARPPNYDESKVAPYTLEDPLVFADGSSVRTPADWDRRRAEIIGIFEREMYGRTPPAPEAVVTEVLEEGPTLAGLAIRRQYRMWFKADKSGPFVDWLAVIPNRISGDKPQVRDGRVVCENREKCPVILMLNYRGNHTVLTDKEVKLAPHTWLRPGLAELVRTSWSYPDEAERGQSRSTQSAAPIPIETIIARGYALVTACYGQISPDAEARYADASVVSRDFAYTGIFSLWPRGTTDWETTSLGAWAWTLSRGLDLAFTIPEIDAGRAVATGFSRLGKTALLAASRDTRFKVCVVNQTGGGGVPLAKRDFGENVSTEMKSFPHWYCAAYGKYVDNESAMKFDQHLLVASIAPRALLVEGFNSAWFDTRGEYLSCRAAAPVWTFLGKGTMPDVEFPENFSTAAIGDCLGYVRRGGEHGISGSDWQWMLDFADRNLK